MTDAHAANREAIGERVNYRALFVIFLFAIVLWFTPHPEEITQQAWHLFVIFVATILGIILRPLPVAAVVLMGMVACMVTQTLPTQAVFSAYGKNSIWLIVMSFFLARGLVKTGLAVRISYQFIKWLGRHTLGLVYGIGFSELLLAPIIPSLVARSGGVVYPILLATAENLEKDHPGQSVERTNGYLMVAGFQVSGICSAMFLTSMAANPIIVEIAGELGINISWADWALAAVVPGLASLLIVPYVLYKFMNIEIKHTPKAAELAHQKIEAMGKITRNEWLMLLTFAIVLFLWIFGWHFGINSVAAAMFGVALLLVTGVLEWKDCIEEETAWATLFWLGGLISMGTALKTLGLFTWLSHEMVSLVGALDWQWGLLILSLFYFYSHYLFASNTAHVTAMFSAFLVTAIEIGSPGKMAALLLAFFSNLFGGLTHYSSGPAPIFYAAHYVTLQRWWLYGFLTSVVNIVIWIGLGSLWWKVLGIY